MKISYFLKEGNTSLYTCHLYEIVEILRYLTSIMEYIPLDSSPPFDHEKVYFSGQKGSNKNQTWSTGPCQCLRVQNSPRF